MTPLTVKSLIGNPAEAALHLKETIYGLMMVRVAITTPRFAVLRLMLRPWQAAALEGYPMEYVRIGAWSSGTVLAVPEPTDTRPWLHRFPDLLRQLCLWDPWDPPSLRWHPDDGVAAFVRIVHRHLHAEEHWRRTGRWPVEDAPHGEGPHPIRSALMRNAALVGATS
jgi:hypothetical protein